MLIRNCKNGNGKKVNHVKAVITDKNLKKHYITKKTSVYDGELNLRI